jgi:enamine deaminase RidA (YjgF/YER057c/UK114 family)
MERPILRESTASHGATMSIEDKLKSLGLSLPPAPAPAANYVPFVLEGNLLFIAGQIPRAADGSLPFKGKVGKELTEQQGYEAARLCALNCLAQVKAALGSLDKVKRVAQVRGFVNCADGFANQPEVINGASDLIIELFGDKGRHARAAVGANALPRDVATEVEMLLIVG